MRRTRVTGAVVALALAAAGCAGPPVSSGGPVVSPGADVPVVNENWAGCAAAVPPREPDTVPGEWPGDGLDAVTLPPLGDGFAPVAAVACLSEQTADPVLVEKRAEDVTELVAALRLPDEEPSSQACTFELRLAPWLALLDADGRWVRPGLPVDSCGKVRMEVLDAFDDLTFTT